jgi:GNAT superfamily N-acetyltransferase
MEWVYGDYRVSTDKTLLSLETIHRFLKASYWANERSYETMRKSIANSLCFGLYHMDEMIGFARVVTDYATFFWLCDVFIDPAERDQGLGKFLIGCVVQAPELQGLRGMLATRDAHRFYTLFGFQAPHDPRWYMVRPADSPAVRIPFKGKVMP